MHTISSAPWLVLLLLLWVPVLTAALGAGEQPQLSLQPSAGFEGDGAGFADYAYAAKPPAAGVLPSQPGWPDDSLLLPPDLGPPPDPQSPLIRRESGRPGDGSPWAVPVEAPPLGSQLAAASGKWPQYAEHPAESDAREHGAFVDHGIRDVPDGSDRGDEVPGHGKSAHEPSHISSIPLTKKAVVNVDDGRQAAKDPVNTEASTKNPTGENEESVGHVKRKTGLPDWLLVIFAAIIATVLVLISGAIAARLSGTHRSVPSEAEKLERELEETRARAEALNAALVAKRRAEEEERRRAAQEEQPDEQPSGPDFDALVGELHARTAGLDRAVGDGVRGGLKQNEEIIARADQVRNVVQTGVEEFRSQAETLAKDGTMELVSKVQGAMGSTAEVPSWLVDMQNGNDGARVMPPFGLLLAGCMAPAWTASAATSASVALTLNSIMVGTCGAVGVLDWGKSCVDSRIWFWLCGVAAGSGLAVICNSIVRKGCLVALEEMKKEAKDAEVEQTGIPLWDTFNSVQQGTGRLFRNVLRHEKIVGSVPYSVSNALTGVWVVWGFYGFFVTVNDIVEDTVNCDLKLIVTFLHMYTFFYVFLLLFILIGFVLWLVSVLSKFSFVKKPIIKICKDLDDMNPMKLPIFLSLAKVFVLGGSSDMLSSEEDEIARNISELEKLVEKTTAELDQKRQDAERVKAQREEAQETEAKLIDVYQKQVDEGLAEVAPFVAMLAAGSQGQGPVAGSAGEFAGSLGQTIASQASAVQAAGVMPSSVQMDLSAGSSGDYLASLQQTVGEAASAAAPAFQGLQDQACGAVAAAGVGASSSAAPALAKAAAGGASSRVARLPAAAPPAVAAPTQPSPPPSSAPPAAGAQPASSTPSGEAVLSGVRRSSAGTAGPPPDTAAPPGGGDAEEF